MAWLQTMRRVAFLVTAMMTSHYPAYVMAITNMHSVTNTHGGTAWGNVCYSKGDYSPSCGWEAIVSSSYAIDRVEVWDFNPTKVDDYTYKLTPKYERLKDTRGSTECPDLNVYGPFGATTPNVAVTYSCICTTDTSGACLTVPHTRVLPWNYVPTTPAAVPPSTAPPSTAPPAVQSTADASGASGWVGATSNTNVASILLTHFKGSCYTGAGVGPVLFPVAHLTECGSRCLRDVSCLGINFYGEAMQCYVVTKEATEGGVGLEFVSGCQFWKVLWKK